MHEYSEIKRDISDIKEKAFAAIQSAENEQALRAVEVEYLGRNGRLTAILRGLKNLPEKERREAGEVANELRQILELKISSRKSLAKEEEQIEHLRKEAVDITQPGKPMWRGSLHPLTLLQRDIVRIFSFLGFEVAGGNEVETEWYNFDALNIPENHPSRDMWDTFWMKNNSETSKGKNFKSQGLLLRTHTSPVQVRYLEHHQPPLRIIVPGKVFRYEATDASHEIQFHQLEGLMVGRDVSLAHFKYVITIFLQKLFSKHITVRLRPSYFPFVEPGVEVDMSCVFCSGEGCNICKQTGWIEMAGAGMVHPHVFKAAGLNASGWQGFAFGFGLDRIAMMKYRIPDIRLFYEGDTRFLKQF